jgi:hypothetical protein
VGSDGERRIPTIFDAEDQRRIMVENARERTNTSTG